TREYLVAACQFSQIKFARREKFLRQVAREFVFSFPNNRALGIGEFRPGVAFRSVCPGNGYNWMRARWFRDNAPADSDLEMRSGIVARRDETAANDDRDATRAEFCERTRRTKAERGRYRPEPGARGFAQNLPR